MNYSLISMDKSSAGSGSDGDIREICGDLHVTSVGKEPTDEVLLINGRRWLRRSLNEDEVLD